MPLKYHIRPEYNLIILVHIGTIPDDEFINFYKSLYEKDPLLTTMNHLVDLRQTDSTPRSSSVLSQFAEFMKGRVTETAERPKVAVVAPKDLSFGLARMYEVFADQVKWDFVVFRDIDAALAWIGLPEDFINGLDLDAL